MSQDQRETFHAAHLWHTDTNIVVAQCKWKFSEKNSVQILCVFVWVNECIWFAFKSLSSSDRNVSTILCALQRITVKSPGYEDRKTVSIFCIIFILCLIRLLRLFSFFVCFHSFFVWLVSSFVSNSICCYGISCYPMCNAHWKLNAACLESFQEFSLR